MKRPHFLLRSSNGLMFAACVVLAATTAVPVAFSQAVDPGEELFRRQWVANDERAGGDGLGPMHNETSCAGCHLLGGLGGAGGIDKNVDLISIVPPGPTADRQAFNEKAGKVHPGFADGTVPTLLLHRFGPEADYAAWRSEFYGIDKALIMRAEAHNGSASKRGFRAKRAAWSTPVLDVKLQGIDFKLSHRNTTALFGAGLIDSIDDKTLAQLERQQADGRDGISGRVPVANQGGPGRFGWRGQTGRLQDFVRQACANELGLQVKGAPQGMSPRSPKYRLLGEDMTDLDVILLTQFIADLPSPLQMMPANRQKAQMVEAGERLFGSIGCSACHVADVGKAKGIYSDLLLHDMGEALADPALPNPASSGWGGPVKFGYASGRASVFEDLSDELEREWRTPPLWGVRDSAPYLHDGRASSLDDAIRLHGGEALPSVKRYVETSAENRAKISAFLNSLAPPAVSAKAAAKP